MWIQLTQYAVDEKDRRVIDVNTDLISHFKRNADGAATSLFFAFEVGGKQHWIAVTQTPEKVREILASTAQ